MLFSSWSFIAAFLPITLIVFYQLQRKVSRDVALSWLIVASLFFYSWFRLDYVLIMLTSILFNFSLGTFLSKRNINGNTKKYLLIFGVTANLSALAYFKYAGFFIETLNVMGGKFIVPDIMLPLAISFFTFQQIAYLVDAYRDKTEELNFRNYTLFVTFFPQLIAGPIVHHKEMIPQFMKHSVEKINWEMLAMGLTVFIIGLSKKIIIADHMGEVADPVFDSAALGINLTFFEVWIGVIAYTLQIYFDFSGYSDMAVGLGAMFGIRIPLNFFSPYKSTNIIDFWRRWHITLSRFLKDYLYIPLGGNRTGKGKRLRNLMVTMLLGGLWHGASWTFVVWGGLHGFYLIINHAWQKTNIRMPRFLAQAITLLAIIVAWVFFRAESFDTAIHILSCMLNDTGITLRNPESLFGQILQWTGFDIGKSSSNLPRLKENGTILMIGIFIVLFAPNTHQFVQKKLALDTTSISTKIVDGKIIWSPTKLWIGMITFLAIFSFLLLTKVNAFIYFQF